MSLLFLPIAWIVTAAGRTLASWLRLPETATPLERSLIGFALGLGLLAYGMLILGLLGWLYPLAGLLWVFALALLGGRRHGAMARDLGHFRPGRLPGWGWGAVVLFLLIGVAALSGVYAPPGLMEWDSLSYHLAVPKLYLQAHRIFYIPWLLHSNFAFTTEMWYTLGLMAGSVPLAKLFHFGCAVGTCLAIYGLGARLLTPRVGVWAALLLASTPVFLWEAGTAYVDIATVFFTVLTLLALANGLTQWDSDWLRIGAILMGLAVSTKATAFLTLVLLSLGLLIWQHWVWKRPVGYALRTVAAWAALALVVSSPWYLKSWADTGNPVYPFAYHLFGGHYWSAAATTAYNASNSPGMGHTPSAALLLPWNLTMHLMPGHPTSYRQPFNEFASPVFAVPPLLLACLFFPAFGRRPTPPAVRVLAVYALGALLLWFVTTQFVRFLLPLLPVLCLLAAWTLGRARAAHSLSGYALLAFTVCSLLWSASIAVQLTAARAPVALGFEPPDVYLAANDPGYDAMRFINTRLPPHARVIFYGHPLGYYCDRSYLWANEYTDYIPTATFHSAEDLRRYLQRLGVTDILIDLHYYQPVPRDDNDEAGWLYQLTAGHGPPLYAASNILIYPLPPA